jgi:hypothetical protein
MIAGINTGIDNPAQSGDRRVEAPRSAEASTIDQSKLLQPRPHHRTDESQIEDHVR